MNIEELIKKYQSSTELIMQFGDYIITPGLIDQHIHGGYGVNFNTACAQEIIVFTQKLFKQGITAFLPTVMTDSENVIKKQIEQIKIAQAKQGEKSSKILGINLEGPYLSPDYKGIQPIDNLQAPTIENFKRVEDEIIKMVTLAPELDESLELTKYLVSKGIIVSAGHTSANQNDIKKAVEAGLTQVTHMYNAMRPIHHREPGVIVEAMLNEKIYSEIIPDGLHVHPNVIEITERSKTNDKIIFVSDSLPLNRAQVDEAVFGGQHIFRKEGKAVNKDGTFAGSLIFLDDAVKLYAKQDLNRFKKAIHYSSINVAQNLGYENKNLIVWENFEIKVVI